MSKLVRDIRATVHAGSSIPAKVVDVHFGKATVRLLSNGHIIHSLDVVGGPVTIGQAVRVDFTTAKPTVVVVGQTGASQQQINRTLVTRDIKGSPKNTTPPNILEPPTSSGHIIQDEGDDLTARSKLNFVGLNVEAMDDEANDATLVTLTSGSGLMSIYHNGSYIGQTIGLNFIDG